MHKVYPDSTEYLTDFHKNNIIKDRCLNIDVLDIGCGTSNFLQEMYDRDGFKKIIAIDFSEVCIKQMDARNATKRKEILFAKMDCSKIDFQSNSFDLVIDKGTMDTLLCENQSYFKVARYLRGVQKVLRIGATFMLVTNGDPSERLLHL